MTKTAAGNLFWQGFFWERLIVSPFSLALSSIGKTTHCTLLINADINRTVPHFIQTRLLTPQISLKMIDLLERILFPLDGYPAPTPPDPTPEEVIDMREKLEKRIDEMVPGKSAPV